MPKRKIKIKLLRKKLVFLSLIISLSIMGVGYAAWNDGTKISISLKTALIDQGFLLEGNRETFNDGKLLYSLSDDGHTLYINGEIYPSFDEDIAIKIIDEGTIPSVFTDVSKGNDYISELNRHSLKQKNNININDTYIESFILNIKPNSDNVRTKQFGEAITINDDKISKLERAIEELELDIKLYDKEEYYNFKYVLNFEQGL